MNIKRTLFILFASCGLVVPSLQAATYSQSFSGGVRVQSTVATSPNANNTAVETLNTAFGGEAEESSTGGDTFLQWNHAFESDDGNTQGTGFIRFAGDGAIRFNVQAESALGNYAASLKAEWQNSNGFDGSTRSGRDQFAVLRHVPTGVYYKIGREEWLNNEKGYTTDFLSKTKDFAGQDQNNRFSLHAIGWSGAGADVALLIQRDFIPVPTQGAGSLFGVTVGPGPGHGQLNTAANAQLVSPNGDTASDVQAFGLSAAYAAGAIDAKLIILSGTQNSNEDRVSDGGTSAIEGSASTTQLNLAFPLPLVTPFLNYGTHARTIDATMPVMGATKATVHDFTRSGWNLGASVNFGPSDLVLAYGSVTSEDAAKVPYAAMDNGQTSSGFDLMWATNQDPLKVSLAFTSATTAFDDDTKDDATNSIYGVRLDYSF